MPKFLFPPGWLDLFVLKDLEEIRSLAEAGAGSGGGPETGVMGAEVPGRRAAHAETANHDAVRIDLVLALHRIERLEQVHLAGQLVGVAVPSIQMQHDGV